MPEPETHPAWPGIARLLEQALEEPDHELFRPDIDTVWIAFEGETIFAAATTRLRTDGIAELRLAAGTRHREWVAALDSDVTAWARLCGASKLTMRGRKGWGRYARPFGWVASQDGNKMLFEKAL